MKKIEVEGIDISTYAGKAANAVKTKAKGIFGDDLLIFSLIDFVSFMLLNNKFSSKGIFISEENREDKYIEIIESGDFNLIQDLEQYIELIDKIKLIKDKQTEYNIIIENLQNLNDMNDETAVNAIIEEYLRR